MYRGLSFRHAASLVGEKHPAFKALDSLLGGALLVGTAGGSQAALGLFDAKSDFISRATELGDSLVRASQGLGRLDRVQQIQAANSVLLVMSFFETLSLLGDREFFIDESAEPSRHQDWAKVSPGVGDIIARTIRRRVRAAFQEQDRLAGNRGSSSARRAARKRLAEEAPALPDSKIHQILIATSIQPADGRLATVAQALLEAELPQPAPHLPYEVHLSEVESFYHELAGRYAQASLGVDWDTLEPHEQIDYQSELSSWVSARATSLYQGHFQKLAALSTEVAFWANAIDHQATRRQIEQVRLGLAGLVEGLSLQGQVRATTALALSRVYQAALHRAVVETNDLLVPGMAVPALHEIYVNPEFRSLRADPRTRLELESTWLERAGAHRDDIQSFLVGYLSSPAATEAPLLLLGQPGSGKSVLTKVLAARLPEQEFLAVRVVLREIPADGDVQTQIEAAIYSDTGERIGWTQLLETATGLTPVLLFDGFDELLQATGVTQSDYLERIAKFQKREASLGRPCVAVVTSRTAVADRARIPHGGVTAVRLEAFSDEQVHQWTEVWNATNAEFFEKSQLKQLSPAAVLDQQELARQPLLLLMLALYDANDNALHELSTGEDRSLLYERLLEAFARRELRKSETSLDEEEIVKFTEGHIQELSIAALSMFNRGRQWVLVHELDEDMSGLGTVPISQAAESSEFRRTYSAGEALIGKFFFVHEARAVVGERTLGTIEFLHATFGEYLVARAVARELIQLVEQEKFERRSIRRSALSDGYLAALLGFSALSSRATILEFLHELLRDAWCDDSEVFHSILISFFERCLEGQPEGGLTAYRPQEISRIANSANYSFNLLIILLLNGSVLDAQALFGEGSDANDAWTRHAIFLRSQLTEDAWVWLTRHLCCFRAVGEGGRATRLHLRDIEGIALSEVGTSVVPSDWHFGLRNLGSGSVAELGDYVRALSSNRLASDPDWDLAIRCVEPLVAEIGSMYTLVAIGSEGVSVSGAEAIVRLWLASSAGASGEGLTAAYDDCIRLGLVARGPGASNFRSILVRQLAKDLTRLPGRWREQARSDLGQRVGEDSDMGTWVRLMIQSLGLRGRSSSGET